MQSWNVQWDNENQYFQDKGNIAAHFCEGGFAGNYTTFVGVTTRSGDELDPALLYYNGIVPDPDPIDETPPNTEDVERPTEDVERPSEDVERPSEDVERPTEDVERPTEDVQRPTEDVERPTEDVIREPDVEDPIEAEPTPQPTPEPEPSPESPVSPVEPIEPPEVVSPSPEPVEPPTSPTEPEISPEVPVEPEMSAAEVVGAIINAFATAGLDMTPEERKQAQSVVIPSVIVAQVAAMSFRKVK